MRRSLITTTAILAFAASTCAQADDLKIALIYGKTGPARSLRQADRDRPADGL
ncbi:hypothetical protein ACVWW5_008031 [Bradyrhizobium sp. LM3.4]